MAGGEAQPPSPSLAWWGSAPERRVSHFQSAEKWPSCSGDAVALMRLQFGWNSRTFRSNDAL
jgi:hypothetical protein